MSKLGIIVSIVIATILLWILFYQNIYRLLGYYITTDQNVLAQYLVDQHLPFSDCLKLMHFKRGTAPSVSEKRLDCVVRYAVIAKNPSICEQLMPSQYGLECISSTWGPLIDESNCHWYQDNSVRCFEGEKLIPRVTVCEQSSVKKMPDECWHRIAFKNKDAAMCKTIENSILRSVCEVRINTWNQFPELRSTQYFSLP